MSTEEYRGYTLIHTQTMFRGGSRVDWCKVTKDGADLKTFQGGLSVGNKAKAWIDTREGVQSRPV